MRWLNGAGCQLAGCGSSSVSNQSGLRRKSETWIDLYGLGDRRGGDGLALVVVFSTVRDGVLANRVKNR